MPWIGPAARNPAAWLMAIAAGHVYYTSVVLSETPWSLQYALGEAKGLKLLEVSPIGLDDE